ncbi:MAG TPA: hypothetical protein PLX84_04780, partial [Acidiphilium sp.]|nr:hypothetical protein [Acidiphilium sp.]
GVRPLLGVGRETHAIFFALFHLWIPVNHGRVRKIPADLVRFDVLAIDARKMRVRAGPKKIVERFQ